jgi:hypothetical protein
MRRYSFSILGLMVVIGILALGFVALRMPSRIWVNAWFSLALGGVTVAVPAAVVTTGDGRAFSVGFAVCGWVYFLFALAPWVDERASHQLLTTTILDVASPYFVDNTYLINSYKAFVNPPRPPDRPTPWQVWNLPDLKTSANEEWRMGYVTLHCPFEYLRIGHGLFCLLLGIAGGEIARFLYVRRQHSASSEPPR